MHAASDKIQQQLAIIAKQAKELADKEKDFDLRSAQLQLELKKETAQQNRLDYEAETKRLVALGNSGPAVSVEQIQPIVRQLVQGMLQTGNPGETNNAPGVGEGGTPMGEDSVPGVPGSRQAPDGNHYTQINGKWHRIDQKEEAPAA